MKAEFIYDLLLFHTYSRLSGFLVNLLGLAVIITGGFLLRNQTIQLCQAFVYIAVGVMILMFTPINLRLQAGRMMGQPGMIPRYSTDLMKTASRRRWGAGQNIWLEHGTEGCLHPEGHCLLYRRVISSGASQGKLWGKLHAGYEAGGIQPFAGQDLYKINMGAAAAAPFLCLPLMFAMLFSGDT